MSTVRDLAFFCAVILSFLPLSHLFPFTSFSPASSLFFLQSFLSFLFYFPPFALPVTQLAVPFSLFIFSFLYLFLSSSLSLCCDNSSFSSTPSFFSSPLFSPSSPVSSVLLHDSRIFLERIIMFSRLYGDYMFIYSNLSLCAGLRPSS